MTGVQGGLIHLRLVRFLPLVLSSLNTLSDKLAMGPLKCVCKLPSVIWNASVRLVVASAHLSLRLPMLFMAV